MIRHRFRPKKSIFLYFYDIFHVFFSRDNDVPYSGTFVLLFANMHFLLILGVWKSNIHSLDIIGVMEWLQNVIQRRFYRKTRFFVHFYDNFHVFFNLENDIPSSGTFVALFANLHFLLILGVWKRNIQSLDTIDMMEWLSKGDPTSLSPKKNDFFTFYDNFDVF